jgi:hypothetical protein
MGIKNIRTYTPGTDDFLHFAETMNKNYAIDLKKVAPNGTPLQAPEALGGNVGGANPIQETNAGEVPPVNTEQGAVTGATDTSTVDTTVDTTTDTTVTPTTVPTTDAYSGGISWDDYKKNNGVLEEKDWYAAQGLDPEADYQNTVNALNYAYQTSMATYGENVEKLFQMGLQNSGVSDIFQANALYSYLANMKSAANARIAANKQNKALYNAYISGKKSEYNTWKNSQATLINEVVTNAQQLGVTSESSDDFIRATLESAGITDVTDELISTVRSKVGKVEDAVKSETVIKTNDAIGVVDQALVEATGNGERENTYDEYLDADARLEELIAQGYDEETIDTKKEEYRKKRVEIITNVSKGDNNTIENAYKTLGTEFLGKTEEDWKQMNDGDQREWIVKRAGELIGTKGGITREEYGQIVSDWVDIETKSMIKSNNESKDNNAFIRAGSLVFELDELYREGYLTEEQYKDKINQIISNIQFGLYINGTEYSKVVWNGTVAEKDSAQSQVQVGRLSKKAPNDIVNVLNEKYDQFGGAKGTYMTNGWNNNGIYHLVELEGKLYGKSTADGSWYEISHEDIGMVDNLWYARTPSDNQKYGMYQLLVTMLENKENSKSETPTTTVSLNATNKLSQEVTPDRIKGKEPSTAGGYGFEQKNQEDKQREFKEFIEGGRASGKSDDEMIKEWLELHPEEASKFGGK